MRFFSLASAVVLAAAICAAQVASTDIADLKTKAEAGDVRAQDALGRAYEDGKGVPQNDQLAVKWYRAAAEKGDAEAQNDLGVMYRVGHGVEKDANQAVAWFRKAARQGHAAAMFNLGTFYYNDQEIRANDKVAYAWFVLAANAGNKSGVEAVERMNVELRPYKLAEGKVVLANMLLKGEEVATDVPRALSLLDSLSADDVSVAVQLGRFYISDSGIAHDYPKAERYCLLAANANYTPGMVCLGFLNASGVLGSNKDEDAFSWYERAAHLGSPVGAFALSIMYREGWGIQKDLQKAYMWAFLASEFGRLTDAKPATESLAQALGPKAVAKMKDKAGFQQADRSNRKQIPIHVVNNHDLEFTSIVSSRKQN